MNARHDESINKYPAILGSDLAVARALCSSEAKDLSPSSASLASTMSVEVGSLLGVPVKLHYTLVLALARALVGIVMRRLDPTYFMELSVVSSAARGAFAICVLMLLSALFKRQKSIVA